jgi:hypothetical protein
MVRRAIQAQEQQARNLTQSNAGLLLAKFLAKKLDPKQLADPPILAVLF